MASVVDGAAVEEAAAGVDVQCSPLTFMLLLSIELRDFCSVVPASGADVDALAGAAFPAASPLRAAWQPVKHRLATIVINNAFMQCSKRDVLRKD